MRHTVIFASAFATAMRALSLPTCGKALPFNLSKARFLKSRFQTLLVSRVAGKLGYTVNKPSEVDYNVGVYLHRLWRCDVRRELAAAA